MTADPSVPTQNSPQPGSRLRKWAYLAGGLLALLILVYFVVSSSAFIKAVVLPRINERLGGTLTVTSLSVSPFSQVTLEGPKLTTTGSEPLFEAKHLEVEYSFWNLMLGRIAVEKFIVDSPVLQIIQNADGTSNLDPLLQTSPTESESRRRKPSDETPLQVALRQVELRQARIRQVTETPEGSRTVTELRGFDLTLDRLENNQAGTFQLAGQFDYTHLEGQSESTAPARHLNSRFDGKFAFELGPRLLPKSVEGTSQLEVMETSGSFDEVNGLKARVRCRLTPTELQQLALQFQRDGMQLGEITASGPLDIAAAEGRLKIAVRSIDRQVLNLFGASRGWDFGGSTLNATNLVDLSAEEALIAVSGNVKGNRLGVRHGTTETPKVDLDLNYQVTFNREENTALIQQLDMQINRDTEPMIRATLDRPMHLSWGQALQGLNASTWQLQVNQLNLADWRPFLNTNLPAGQLSAQLNVVAQRDGRRVETDLEGNLQGLQATVDTRSINLSSLTFQLNGVIEEFRKFTVTQLNCQAVHQGETVAQMQGSANYNANSQKTTAQLSLEASLPHWLAQYPLPSVAANSGRVKFSAFYTGETTRTNMVGNVSLDDFNGRYGDWDFQDYDPSMEWVVELKENQWVVERANLEIQQGFRSAANFDVSARYQVENQSAEFEIKNVTLNQYALQPFFPQSASNAEPVSFSAKINGSGSYAHPNHVELQSQVQIEELAFNRPGSEAASWKGELNLIGAWDANQFKLRRLLVSLPPTSRADNRIELQGELAFPPNQPTGGGFTLRSEALDLTALYQQWIKMTETKSPAEPAVAQAPKPASAKSKKQPTSLPFEELTFDLQIGRVYLDEIVASNWIAQAKLHDQQLNLDPFELTLNGAPVRGNSRWDFRDPTPVYRLSLNGDKIPLEPIANTFSPDTEGQFRGGLLLNTELTGKLNPQRPWHESLAGQLQFDFTNAAIDLVQEELKQILTPIAVVLRTPELLQAPLNAVNAQLQADNGRLTVEQLNLLSDALRADTQGTIDLADQLGQSPLNLPLRISLKRSLAEKARLVLSDTPPDAPFVALPQFATVSGTFDDPGTRINKLAVMQLISNTVSGIPGSVGEKAGLIKQGLEILNGFQTNRSQSKTNSQSQTNQPGSNILDLFRSMEKKKE